MRATGQFRRFVLGNAHGRFGSQIRLADFSGTGTRENGTQLLRGMAEHPQGREFADM